MKRKELEGASEKTGETGDTHGDQNGQRDPERIETERARENKKKDTRQGEREKDCSPSNPSSFLSAHSPPAFCFFCVWFFVGVCMYTFTAFLFLSSHSLSSPISFLLSLSLPRSISTSASREPHCIKHSHANAPALAQRLWLKAQDNKHNDFYLYLFRSALICCDRSFFQA